MMARKFGQIAAIRLAFSHCSGLSSLTMHGQSICVFDLKNTPCLQTKFPCAFQAAFRTTKLSIFRRVSLRSNSVLSFLLDCRTLVAKIPNPAHESGVSSLSKVLSRSWLLDSSPSLSFNPCGSLPRKSTRSLLYLGQSKRTCAASSIKHNLWQCQQ